MSVTTAVEGVPTCARPGCNNPLNRGKQYCSPACAAQDRMRVKAQDQVRLRLHTSVRNVVPEMAQKQLISLLGDAAVPVIEELAIELEEQKKIVYPPLLREVTESGLIDGRYGVLISHGKSYRADDEISYDTIDDMMRDAMVIFALQLKQAPISSVLRNPNAYVVEGDDERLGNVVKGIMERTFRRNTKDFMEYIPYGSAFFEKVWDRKSAKEWGIEGADGDFYGYDALRSMHPRSIECINYTKSDHFDGFTQSRQVGGPVDVPADRALVLSYRSRYRNLWGSPATDPMYPFWFWLQVAWRSLLRYLERHGTPVTVMYAPGRGEILGPDGTKYNSMKYALMQAGYVMHSNVAAIPSDVDPDTGQQLWKVDYLQPQGSSGDQFIKAIELLGTHMTRAVVVGDTAATVPGSDAGSYAMSSQHWAITQIHNEAMLEELLSQLNEYLVGPLVEYNGKRGQRAEIVARLMDAVQRERLFGLLNTMGNQQGSSAMKMVDWRSILSMESIPTLTDEEIQKEYEQELERTKERNEMMAESGAQGNGMPFPKKGVGPEQEAKEKQAEAEKPPVRQSAEWAQWQVLNGRRVPVLLTEEQAQDLIDRAVENTRTIFDMAGDPVQLFNPNHDEMGRFASKSIGGMFKVSDEDMAKAYTFADDLRADIASTYGEAPQKEIQFHKTHAEFAKAVFGTVLATPLTYLFAGFGGGDKVHVTPGAVRAIAGKPLLEPGALLLTPEQARATFLKTVAHESIHGMPRKYPPPHPPGNDAAWDRKKWSLSLEEGTTEAMAVVLMHKRGHLKTALDRYRVVHYQDNVYGVVREARARYPDSPSKALEFISKAHRTGFTADGIREVFGNRWVSNGRRIGRNPVADSLGLRGTQGDLDWLLDGTISLQEEDVEIPEEPNTVKPYERIEWMLRWSDRGATEEAVQDLISELDIELEEDDEPIALFNPNHDEMGRFASKQGGGALSSHTELMPEGHSTQGMHGPMQDNYRIIVDADGNRRAIFKKYAGDQEQIWPYNLWGGKAENFRGGRGIAGREVAASMVAEKIGMGDFVARTEWATVDGMEGSVQQWMQGTVAMKAPGVEAIALNKRRMAVFDYLIGNVDRHTRNYLIKGGKAYAIDNGYSFPALGPKDPRRWIAGMANVRVYTPPIPTGKERRAIRAMLEDQDFMNGLEPFIGREALADFADRAGAFS